MCNEESANPAKLYMNTHAVHIESVQNLFPLSPMQTGMLLHTLTRDEKAYRMQMCLRVGGPLVPAHLEQAWRQLIARHVMFRSLFALSGAPDPLQVVLKELPEPFTLPLEDLSALDAGTQQRETDRCAEREFSMPLDPKRPPLMRVLLLKYSRTDHGLLITFHHVLMDGWCQGILHQELLELYRAAAAGTPPSLPPAPDYAAYIRWLRERDPEASRTYWRKRLEIVEDPGQLPGHHPAEGPFVLGRRPRPLPPELGTRLRRIGTQANASFNAVFQALWGILVARCNHAGPAVFGMVVSGRPPEVPGINGMIGLFINTVPMIIEVRPEESFLQLVRRVAGDIAEGMPHHYLPTPEILESHPLRDRLLRHAVAFENFPDRQEPGHPDAITLAADGDFQGYTNYDFLCLVDPGETVTLHLKFNRNAIPEDRVEFLAEAFLQLAQAAADNPECRIDALPFLPDRERRTLLTALGAGPVANHPCPTVLDGFHRTVRNHPGREAVIAGDGRLTYAELEQRAHRLAHGLLAREAAGANRPIAILLERDSWMIPSLLGVLMSGSAYLPMAPDYPPERIRFLLEDAGCNTVITRDSLRGRIPADWPGTCLDVEAMAAGQPVHPPDVHPGPRDLAYLIYTSGSTGTPKGVAVEHAALANFVQGFNDCLAFPGDAPGRVAFIANYVFDASGRAIYPPLLRGGTIAVVDAETRVDGTRLARLIADEPLDILDGTPTLCGLLLQVPEPLRRRIRLRHLIVGGEAMPATFPAEVEAAGIGNPVIHNVYGPTETTIDSTWKRLLPGGQPAGTTSIPIGRPLPNQQVYILDANLNLLPRGSEGELCIGGAGLARGYLNQDTLTATRFVPLPWDPATRIYRTGDRVCWNRDGDMDYLGRMDQQVKIRGYRIEPGEIEARLKQHPRVASGVVVALTRDATIGPELVAYYTVSGQDPGEADLRHWLSTLPGHMMPAMFMRLDTIPLTVNGKLNRRALPLPESADAPSGAPLEPPANETEARLIPIWSRILGRPGMGRNDNFFDLGGHSLRAAQVATRTGQAFQRDIPPLWIYIAPTPAAFARLLHAQDDAAARGVLDTHFVLGAGQPRRLFCLPPYGGSGIAYTALHQALDGFELVCLNVPAQPGGFVRAAADLIQKLEPRQPLDLLGYSGGGNYAFQVTQHLESAGRDVRQILMIDCHRRLQAAPVETAAIAREIDDLMHAPEVAVYLESPSMRKDFRERAIRYSEELFRNTDSGTVRANIGLLCAEGVFETEPYRDQHGLVRSRRAWAECTTGQFHMENARGSHERVITPPFVEAVAKQVAALYQRLQASGSPEHDHSTR